MVYVINETQRNKWYEADVKSIEEANTEAKPTLDEFIQYLIDSVTYTDDFFILVYPGDGSMVKISMDGYAAEHGIRKRSFDERIERAKNGKKKKV